MSVRPWRAEIRFYKTGKMGPGNSGAGNLGSRQCRKRGETQVQNPYLHFNLFVLSNYLEYTIHSFNVCCAKFIHYTS